MTKVKVYSSPSCVYCHMAKEYLKSKRIDFQEVDVSVDREAAQWVLDRVGQIATPVIEIGETIILGFDRQKIDAALRE